MVKMRIRHSGLWFHRLLPVVVGVLVASGTADAQAQMADPSMEPARTPVVLIPGWADDAGRVEPLGERLVESGWPSPSVLTLTFQDVVGSNDEHAAEVASAVARLRTLSGSEKVDIVAHSMGGLAVRRYLELEGGDSVRRIVFLATPHHGTMTAILAWGDGGREMVPGSDFLEELNEETEADGEIEMLAVRSPLDLVVIPNSSAILPEAENIEVCCPTHQGMVDDPEVFRQVLGFLSSGTEGLIDRTQPSRLVEIGSRR